MHMELIWMVLTVLWTGTLASVLLLIKALGSSVKSLGGGTFVAGVIADLVALSWVGAVTASEPKVAHLVPLTWMICTFCACISAVSIAALVKLHAATPQGALLGFLIALIILDVLYVFILPEYLTGWAYGLVRDPPARSLVDAQGRPVDAVFQSATVARFGWWLGLVFGWFFLTLWVMLHMYRRTTSKLVAIGSGAAAQAALYFVLLLGVGVPALDACAAFFRELLHFDFSLPDFGLPDFSALDWSNWTLPDFSDWQFPTWEPPAWWNEDPFADVPEAPEPSYPWEW